MPQGHGPGWAMEQLAASCATLGPATTAVMAAFNHRPSGPPPGCPPEGCHHFWASGSCRHGVGCLYQHVAAPSGWVDTRPDAALIAGMYGASGAVGAKGAVSGKADAGRRLAPEGCAHNWCHLFWKTGACGRSTCKYLHVDKAATSKVAVIIPTKGGCEPAWCAKFWKTGACAVASGCLKLHVANRNGKVAGAPVVAAPATTADSRAASMIKDILSSIPLARGGTRR
jgi:hypothetical protein